MPGPLLPFFFFFNDTATTEIYTLSLHDALPISVGQRIAVGVAHDAVASGGFAGLFFGLHGPFEGAVGADVAGGVGIGVFKAALGAGGSRLGDGVGRFGGGKRARRGGPYLAIFGIGKDT